MLNARKTNSDFVFYPTLYVFVTVYNNVFHEIVKCFNISNQILNVSLELK